MSNIALLDGTVLKEVQGKFQTITVFDSKGEVIREFVFRSVDRILAGIKKKEIDYCQLVVAHLIELSKEAPKGSPPLRKPFKPIIDPYIPNL